MPARVRVLLPALLVLVAVATAAGCDGQPPTGDARRTDPPMRVALLLPHAGADRYEAMDQPYFELRLRQRCPTCQVDYRNAGNNQAVQNQQAQEALAQGARVLVLDPVDSPNAAGIVEAAHARKVPVISYDRLILGTPVDYYLSFDNVKVGQIAGAALLTALGDRAATAKILMINGPPADNNAIMYKQGAHQMLDGKVRVAAEYTMSGPAYDPPAVEAWLRKTLPSIGARTIAGAYCVDDNSAGLVAAALTAAGVTQLPPITGHNADIAGLQRILTGNQYMTVYKPVPREAQQAADLTYALLRGERPEAPATVDNRAGGQPAFLLEPQTVTRANLKETVLKDGYVTVGALCAAAFTEACRQAGIN